MAIVTFAQYENSPYIFSRPLEINASSGLVRLKIYIESKSPAIAGPGLIILNKLLLASGVFKLEPDISLADVKLKISETPFFNANFNFLTNSDNRITEAGINIIKNDTQIENKLVSVIDKAIYAIDGKKSLFNSAIVFSEDASQGARNIILTDFLGKRRIVLLQNGKFNVLPHFSKDGTKIVFTTLDIYGTNSFILDLKTNFVTPIVLAGGTTTGGTFVNNDELLMTRSFADQTTLYLYNIGSHNWQRLINDPYIATNGRVFKNKLLYTSNRSRGAQVFIKEDYLNISAPSKRLSFIGPDNSEPNFNHAGNIILYSSYLSNLSQIFLTSEDGFYIRQLTFDENGAEGGLFSPDDRQVLYTTSLKESQRLKFITLDGEYQRELNIQGSSTGRRQSAADWTQNFDWSMVLGVK